MELNARQKEAVEYLDGPLLVVAGPGTGKTQLLSSKVEYILKNTDTVAENILCLTFTETGASNMRERLKSIIGKDALKITIGTYHAFGRDILAQYKNYSETYDRDLDTPIDEIRQYKIVKELQDNLDGRDILRGDSIENIIKTIGEAKGAQLSADDLEKVALQNIADAEVISSAISPFLKNIVPRKFKESFDNAYAPIFEVLRPQTEVVPMIAVSSGAPIARLIYEVACDLRDAINEATADGKIKPLSAWKDKYFEKDGLGNFRLKGRVANKKLMSLSRIMRDYENYLRENGLFDFNDMIQEAIKALQSDEGFKLTLEEKYQVILLDEFQDTNPAQLSIVKQITDYEKPLIMAVGDDDQAIFAFQGALASNLRDFKEYYDAKVVKLEENYRSTQEILDFSQAVIEQADDRYDTKHLVAFKGSPSESRIERREFREQESEYAYVAKKISDLIAAGVPQHKIAVISYKTKYFEPLLPYLKMHPEIKIAYERQNDVLADTRIHQLVNLSKYIHDLSQNTKSDVSLIEILGYDFFEIAAIDVLKTVETARYNHKPVFESLADSDNPKIRDTANFIAKLALKSLTEPLEVMLDYIIGARELDGTRSKFLEFVSRGEDDTTRGDLSNEFAFYENLAALRGKVKQYFGGNKALKLSDLIEMLDDYEAAHKMVMTTSPYREAESAVSILSAHKSKGLEFDYVFILSADHSAWGKGKGNNTTLTLPKNMAFIRHTGTTDSEKLRILYVALTRAKEGLFITNSLHDFAGKDPKRLEYFNEYMEGDRVILPFLPNKYVILDYDVDIEAAIKNIKNWLTPYFANESDLRLFYRERAKNLRMSASALTSFIDVIYAGPIEFFKGYIMPNLKEPETEILAYGSLVHSTFQHATDTGCSDDEAVDYYLKELEKVQLPSEIIRKLRDKGPADLGVALREFGTIIRNGRAEVNFSPDKLVVGGVPVTGKIDLMVANEEARTIDIYDYKTSAFKAKKWDETATLYKYGLQLTFYKMLIEACPRFKNYKVRKGHILFVVPDKDGIVYDKEFDFDLMSDAEFLRLVSACYEQISTLKFMDDPDLFVEPDGTLEVEDIMKFAELIVGKSHA